MRNSLFKPSCPSLSSLSTLELRRLKNKRIVASKYLTIRRDREDYDKPVIHNRPQHNCDITWWHCDQCYQHCNLPWMRYMKNWRYETFHHITSYNNTMTFIFSITPTMLDWLDLDTAEWYRSKINWMKDTNIIWCPHYISILSSSCVHFLSILRLGLWTLSLFKTSIIGEHKVTVEPKNTPALFLIFNQFITGCSNRIYLFLFKNENKDCTVLSINFVNYYSIDHRSTWK